MRGCEGSHTQMTSPMMSEGTLSSKKIHCLSAAQSTQHGTAWGAVLGTGVKGPLHRCKLAQFSSELVTTHGA